MGKEFIVCSKCRTENSNSDTNCKNCGFKLKRSPDITHLDSQKQFIITSIGTSLEIVFESNNTANSKISKNESIEPGTEGPCVNCGYLLCGFSIICPACDFNHSNKKIINSFENKIDHVTDFEFSVTRKQNQNEKSELQKPNLNIQMPEHKAKEKIKKENIKPKIGTSVVLEPMDIEDDYEKDLNSIPIHENGTFIKRSNINPSDNTISSQKHALIEKKDGKWYIENLASNKAVFIQITEPFQLKNGDIILIGNNNFFIFKEE